MLATVIQEFNPTVISFLAHFARESVAHFARDLTTGEGLWRAGAQGGVGLQSPLRRAGADLLSGGGAWLVEG